jgi:hypothetical protein
MAPVRFFHKIDGNVRELPDRGPFRYERDLQEFFEEHLHTLTGVEFLASEHPTGPRHGRRIDTLGIDGAGRPVVVEYKRRQDQNVINQGLDYLVWLEDHQAEFRELVRRRLGDDRVTDIDFGASRLLCIAEGFRRQDQIAAENSRRPIELLRYRRYGDAYVALEWVYGDAPKPVPPPHIPPALPKRAAGADPDYSIHEPWDKTSEGTRTLFQELEKLVKSLGSVRTDVYKSVINFKRTVAPGAKPPVVAYVHVLVRGGLDVHIHGKHLSAIPLEDGFTRPIDKGYRKIMIRDRDHIRRAEPLLRAAYDGLRKHGRRVASEPLPGVSQDNFLKRCDEHGKGVFSRILELARRRSMSINWGAKGFSMGVEVDGTRVVVCYAYPPAAGFKQRLYTALHDRAGIERKTTASAETIDRLRDAAQATGLFAPAGRELKCTIDRAFTDDEVDALVAWCESVAQAIVRHGASAASGQ